MSPDGMMATMTPHISTRAEAATIPTLDHRETTPALPPTEWREPSPTLTPDIPADQVRYCVLSSLWWNLIMPVSTVSTQLLLGELLAFHTVFMAYLVDRISLEMCVITYCDNFKSIFLSFWHHKEQLWSKPIFPLKKSKYVSTLTPSLSTNM